MNQRVEKDKVEIRKDRLLTLGKPINHFILKIAYSGYISNIYLVE